MEETGTPEDMPEDARAGFEPTMTLSTTSTTTPSRRTSRRSTRTSPRTRPRRSTTFDTYTTDTCGSPMDNLEVPEIPETPSEPPRSDLPLIDRASTPLRVVTSPDGYFSSRLIRRSASGLPPVWQVGQYCRLESAKLHLAHRVAAHRARPGRCGRGRRGGTSSRP